MVFQKVLVICLAASSATYGLSLAFPKTKSVNSELWELSNAQKDLVLNLRLDVGREEEPHIPIDGLTLELKDVVSASESPPLPATNGPSPNNSGGARALRILQEAHFVSLDGRKKVDLQDGCWEMIWRKRAPAGFFVCGFNIPEEVRRNDATLSRGRLYISFPIWSKEGLAESQAVKLRVSKDIEQQRQAQNKELAKMQNTSNLPMKALYYRNAAAALEKISNLGVNGPLNQVPMDDDVMPIQNGLLLCTKGTIWTKEQSVFGKEHVLLGVASIFMDKTLCHP